MLASLGWRGIWERFATRGEIAGARQNIPFTPETGTILFSSYPIVNKWLNFEEELWKVS
jgi:hypothetical protein